MNNTWKFLLLPRSFCTKTNRDTPWLFAYCDKGDGLFQCYETKSAANIDDATFRPDHMIRNNHNENIITALRIQRDFVSTIEQKIKLGYKDVFEVECTNSNLIKIICTFFQIGADYLMQQRILSVSGLINDILAEYAVDLKVSKKSSEQWQRTIVRFSKQMITNLDRFGRVNYHYGVGGLKYLNEPLKNRHLPGGKIIDAKNLPTGSLCPVW